MSEIYLINISGDDKPGILSSLTEVLTQYGIYILDINQVVIHDYLSLGILIEIPQEIHPANVLKDLVFKAHELEVTLKYTPIIEEEYEKWVHRQGEERTIVTLLGRKISAKQLLSVTKIIVQNKLNIDIITRLSGRPSLNEDSNKTRACVELAVRGTPLNLEAMKADFLETAHNLDVDISFQQDNAYRRNRRLVAFDMDSTLIQAEVIDELAKKAGIGNEVSKITEAAMRGEINFNESLQQRLKLLKGLPESVMKEIADQLPLTEGAERLISNLKAFGYKTAIISGGFTYFGEHLKKRLNIDYVFANELEIKDGKITGQVVGEIIDGLKKAEILKKLAHQENINLEQVIAVGDGANDLPMLSIAGLGIAFHAKPIVKKGAKHSISTIGLDGILYLIGVRDRDTMA